MKFYDHMKKFKNEIKSIIYLIVKEFDLKSLYIQYFYKKFNLQVKNLIKIILLLYLIYKH